MEEKLLEVDGIDVFHDDAQAIRDVSFAVPKGAVVALLGANGAGKSTLLNTISCFHRPASGEIRFEGVALNAMAPEAVVHLGLAHVPEGRRLFSRMTVLENLQLGAFQPAARKRMKRSLEQAFLFFPHLKDRLHQMAGTLSGGEQQMLAMARAMMSQPKLLMLDEPSLGLAPMIVGLMFDIVKQLNASGMTILLVEQNVHQTLQLCDYAYVLQTGCVQMEGSGSNLLEEMDFQKAYLGVGH